VNAPNFNAFRPEILIADNKEPQRQSTASATFRIPSCDHHEPVMDLKH